MKNLSLAGAAVVLAAAGLVSCGEEKKAPAPAPAAVKKAHIKEEPMRFPQKDLEGVKVVDDALMGKAFLGGGNLAHYKRGKAEFDLFLVKSTGAEAAALVLFDYKKALTDAKLIPHFGGYFGKDGDREVFVFTKGAWVAGVAGLGEKDADALARDFASHLN